MRRMSLAVMSLLVVMLSAASPDDFLKEYASQAKVKEFKEADGKTFYNTEHRTKKAEMMSCASCHTKDPTKSGQTTAGKSIEPMAPRVNKKRFTDKAKVEKWFKRNCNDVLERACTPKEKGDFIAYLKGV